MQNPRILEIVFVVATSHFLWACSSGSSSHQTPPTAEEYISTVKYAKHVDPFIGTAGEGNTFPGAVLPWGMASPSPQNTYTDPGAYLSGAPMAAAGYHYGADKITGFGQTHLSGAGCTELGAPVIAPVSGDMDINDYSSAYSNEVAFPGYYSVDLTRFNIRAELTATTRVGVHRFSFPAGEKAYIGVDTTRNLSWNSKEGYIKHLSATEIIGWSKTGKFCVEDNEQRVYFAMRTTTPPIEFGTWGTSIEKNRVEHSGTTTGGYWRFNPGQSVEVYVGISYVSTENALANLNAEIGDQSFDALSIKAIDTWESTLNRIAVSDDDSPQLTMFYTSLYHSILNPSVVSDINGDFPQYRSDTIGNDFSYTRYSIFGLWDTYRGVHPLLTLAYPQVQQDMLRTLEAFTLESGDAPQWEIIGSEVNVMVGDPALIVLSDGYQKGFAFDDIEALFALLSEGALDASLDNTRRPGNSAYQQYGYIPEKTEGVWGSVSTTLEYSFADWALAQMADGLGYTDIRDTLLQQSSGWEKLFDPSTGMLRPKHSDESWMFPFDVTAMKGERPLEGDLVGYSGGPGYVEGNAWHYAFMVPHGLDELAALHGGNQNIKNHLQELFEGDHFTLWNEPDIGSPYLFSLIDNDLTQSQTQIINARNTFFNTTPGGIPGNDDTGALSSWYVFTAMGFYPVNPVSGQYALGIPLFKEVTISLDSAFHPGSQFIITGETNPQTPLPNTTLNGGDLNQGFITHQEITLGGSLTFSSD